MQILVHYTQEFLIWNDFKDFFEFFKTYMIQCDQTVFYPHAALI